MESIDLRLETVTPLFLHGADNKTLDGLRPPPFKALMRYWWRTTQSESNPCENEGRLFGNTERRSPILIRTLGSAFLQTGDYKALPHHTGQIGCPNCAPTPKCQKGYEPSAYRPNQGFTLRLSTTSNLNLYEKISQISFLLGGVGNRSRRGFGSIRYQNWNFATVDELRSELKQTLDGLAPGRFSERGAIIESTLRSFPNYPVIKRIYFGQLASSVDGLLRRIGQATHDHADPALGDADPRMASPIVVRVQKVGDQFVPIITQLSSNLNQTVQQNFINAII